MREEVGGNIDATSRQRKPFFLFPIIDVQPIAFGVSFLTSENSNDSLRLAMRCISMQFRQLLVVGKLHLDGSSESAAQGT